MLKSIVFCTFLFFSSLIFTSTSAEMWGNCCGDYQILEVGVGWRRDNLDWKVKNDRGGKSSFPSKVDSHIHFDDIDLYSAKAKLKFLGSHYFVRLTGAYAISCKGRAKEHFKIQNCYLFECDTISLHTNNHVRRQSEFYDFNLAVGYPFLCLDCRLSIIPLIGYAYDRQNINIKQKHHHSDSFSLNSSYNVFYSNPSSNPFVSSSNENIASYLGIHTHSDSANYRFSWYGPFAGVDLIYSLDNCWTLYAQCEGHFLNEVHRKRHSHTGVNFIDDYHHSGKAYGFEGSFGTYFTICEDWYSAIDVDYRWWKGDSKRDKLNWDSIGINVSLGCMF